MGDYEGHPVIFFRTNMQVGYRAEIGATALMIDERSPIVAPLGVTGFWVAVNEK